MEAMGSIRPPPTFNYMPTVRYEPSQSHALAESFHRCDKVREIIRPERMDCPTRGTMNARGADARRRSSRPDRRPEEYTDRSEGTSHAEETTAYDRGAEATQRTEVLLDPMTPVLLLALGDFNNDFFRVGIPTLEERKHRPSLLCKKERKARSEPREERLIGKI
ncbi:hypothetical protein Cgig2_020666 [Carnegiea gigantea]|uniref:Uncharacterized protein n=1 Tax=Carnegiea gigantea TaxID=171969 RepID=A0A9Q1QJ03_9CARY|nr:hypothetical protein Cgig2_020666 [Carnegiea gigantea]